LVANTVKGMTANIHFICITDKSQYLDYGYFIMTIKSGR